MAQINQAQANQDDEKFKELLMFYVNGTLEKDERAFVENYLQMHPEMNAYVTLHQKIMQAVQGEDEDFEFDEEAARERLLAKVRALKNNKPNTIFERIFSKGLFTHLSGSFQSWGLTPAFGIVFAVLIGQSIILMNIQTEASKYRDIANTINLAPHFKVTVSPKADFYALTELLRKNGCSVVSGPSQNGEIWVKLDDPAKSKQIKADMLRSGLVDEVISVSDDVE